MTLSTIFIRIVNMSLGAAWAALLVMAARWLLRRFPKKYSYALWGVVLFRLVCPVSFSSVFSLMPRTKTIPREVVSTVQPQVVSGFGSFPEAASPALPAAPFVPAPAAPQSVNPVQMWLEIGRCLWLAGMVLLLLYGLVSYLLFARKLQGAVRIEGNLWESDRIPTAFVLGVLHPKIYLPKGISREERQFILCHEQAHIRRRDHLVKPLALLLLAVHWFNPVLWLAYFLLRRDMEMSCDEKAMEALGLSFRKDYTACLLNLSVRQSGLAIPLAFGESDVKSRIKNILNYKKPAFWASVLAVALVAALGLGLISDPSEALSEPEPEEDNIIVLANTGEDREEPFSQEEPSSQEEIPVQQPAEATHGIIHYTAPVRGSSQQTVKGPNGLVYRVAFGTPVYSPIRGTVEEFTDYSIWPYGKSIVVRSSENPDIILRMAHLATVAEGLQVGDQVDSATQIGTAGSTGNANYPAAYVVVRQETDGGVNSGVPTEQWDAIFDNWRDGMTSGSPDPDPYALLGPLTAAHMGDKIWASPQEIKNWLYFFEDLYNDENKVPATEVYGDNWPVAVMVETLSHYFENVTAQDIISSGDYDPATDTIRHNWEREVTPPLLVSPVSWARESGAEELFIIKYRQVYSYVGDPEDKAVYRRLTVRLLPDGSFRYLSNLEGNPKQSSEGENP